MSLLVPGGSLAHLAVVALTQLGDTWFLGGLLVVVHWWAPRWGLDRRTSALVIATALSTMASVTLLKATLAVPRPPGATTATAPSWLPVLLREAVVAGATAEGYAFPSGHTALATAVYGGLAVAAIEGRRRWPDRRFGSLVAGALIVLVAASRVALGVHYPRDVVGGAVLGVTLLAVGLWLGDPGRTLWLAGALAIGAVPSVGIGAGAADLRGAVGTLGGCVGGLLAWRWGGTVPHGIPNRILALGGGACIATGAVVMARPTLAVVGLGTATLGGVGIGLPAIVAWSQHRRAAPGTPRRHGNDR